MPQRRQARPACERSGSRRDERNGRRPRLLAIQAGYLELKTPKLRRGSFMPSLLEPRCRIDRALYPVVMEAYVVGVPTHSVDDLGAVLGADTSISKSEVSRVCAGLDETVDALRGRRLGHVQFPYAYLDATYLTVHSSVGQTGSTATVVATGMTAEGARGVLAAASAAARALRGTHPCGGLASVLAADVLRLRGNLAASSGACTVERAYNAYVLNKTISVPDDVVPIIESLHVPLSMWVTDQLRRHAAESTTSFADQLVADAALAAPEELTPGDALAVGGRMGRSAPW